MPIDVGNLSYFDLTEGTPYLTLVAELHGAYWKYFVENGSVREQHCIYIDKQGSF